MVAVSDHDPLYKRATSFFPEISRDPNHMARTNARQQTSIKMFSLFFFLNHLLHSSSDITEFILQKSEEGLSVAELNLEFSNISDELVLLSTEEITGLLKSKIAAVTHHERDSNGICFSTINFHK